MAIFPLLADPTDYQACDWDLSLDAEARRYWIEHFLEHYITLEALIRAEYRPDDDHLQRFRREYMAAIESLIHRPADHGRITILALDRVRDAYLRRFGFPDPFRHVKAKENQAALEFYPRLIAELDSQRDDARLFELIQGIFAGNIFDLGAMATVKQYHDQGLDFFKTRATLPNRPWLEDSVEAMADRWSPAGWQYRKVMFFVDNAGCDFVLGCLPLIREFAARRLTPVIVAVNSGASLNDILADEADEVLAAARTVDPLLDTALADGRIRVQTSGNNAPLIDLTEVSDELAAAAAGVDLLILEGMGRSVESNRLARFTVDTAWMALLKDPRVADRCGGRLFDICCRFAPAR